MRRQHWNAILALVLVVVGFARAQQTIDLSIDQALQTGFDQSKGLHASLMKVQYADAKSSETGTYLLPSLKFGGAYTRLSSVPSFEVDIPLPPPAPNHFVISPAILDNYNLRVTLQQPLFTGGKIQSAVDAADYSAQATQKDYDKDKADLVYSIKTAYWNLSKAMELEKVVNENVDQIKAHVTNAQSWQSQSPNTPFIVPIKFSANPKRKPVVVAATCPSRMAIYTIQIRRISGTMVAIARNFTSVDSRTIRRRERREYNRIRRATLAHSMGLCSSATRVESGVCAMTNTCSSRERSTLGVT